MGEKRYPVGKPSMHRTVRIPLGLDEAVKAFLKTPQAWQMGYRHKADIITDAVRHLLVSYGFYRIKTEKKRHACMR